MPRKNNPLDLTQPLVPHFFYRRHGPVAKGVIGLEDTQIDDKIKSGELPPPAKAFESGRATGWTGAQLIELQRQRLAKALAAEVEPIKPAEVEPERVEAEPPRKRAKRVTNKEISTTAGARASRKQPKTKTLETSDRGSV